MKAITIWQPWAEFIAAGTNRQASGLEKQK